MKNIPNIKSDYSTIKSKKSPFRRLSKSHNDKAFKFPAENFKRFKYPRIDSQRLSKLIQKTL